MAKFKDYFRKIMAIFRTPNPPKPSSPPQNNIERGDNIVIVTPPVPENLTPPTISGNTSSGSVVTAVAAVWKNPLTVSINRGWFRNGVAILNASNLTYVTVAADEGTDLTFRETATNTAGTKTVVSNIITILAPSGSIPIAQSLPTWSAYQWKVGFEITAVPGTFTGALSVSYRWTRNGVDIPGATGLTYTPTIADTSTTLRFITRGVNASGALELTTNGQVIAPSDVTQPPNDKFYDFTLSSTAPAGISVSRSSTFGTYVNNQLTLVQAPANTPRIHHNASAVPEGIFLEKTRMNWVATGKTPFQGSNWEVLGTASVTSTTEPDVMGGNTASRMSIPAGAGYNGMRYNMNNVATLPMLISFYAKSNTGQDADLQGSPHGGLIKPNWTYFEKIIPPQTELNLDFVTSGVGPIDVTMCLVGVYHGGQLGESIIPTTGATTQRVKEVMTITGPTNYFYDIRVTFANNTIQDFPNEIVNGDWVLDADVINDGPGRNLIKSIGFYSQGGLPGNETPGPTPPPSAPPPGTPPPIGGGPSMLAADDPTWLGVTKTAGGWIGVDENNGYQFSNSTSRQEGNEGLMEGIGYVNSGFRNGPAHGFGSIWRRSPETPNSHIPGMLPNGNYNETTWSNYADPWMVFCHEQGWSGGIGWIDVSRLSMQVQLKSTNKWYWVFHWHPSSPVYRPSRIGWSPNWVTGPGYGQGYDPAGGDRPTALWDSQNQVASLSIKAGGTQVGGQYAGYACHFTFADAQFQYVNAADVKCFLVSALVRRNSASHFAHKGLVHLGMDPKLRSQAPGGGEVWPGGIFPPSSISQTIKLLPEWRPIHCGGMTSYEGSNPRLRLLSLVNKERPMQMF